MTKSLPSNNRKRLAALYDLRVLDSGGEKVYDDIVSLTATLLNTPICLISFVEEDRQWFKAEVGVGVREMEIERSICAHAVTLGEFLVIEDTHLDDRTRDNPLCQGKKPVRFYAGAVLETLDGWPVGTLCVLDYKPRKLNDLQRRILDVNSKSVIRQLELTRVLIETAQANSSNDTHSETVEANQEKTRETLRRFENLTPREKEIMQLIAGRSGNLSSKQIARELGISHRTVDHHRAKILFKMNAGSVAEIIAVSLKAKLFE